jgi:predicted nucleic acid-binding protein
LSFLLDTNVVSEWARPRPDPNVLAWLASADEDKVFLSVLSFAELRRGVELLQMGPRRRHLSAWIANDLFDRFYGRIVDVDLKVAEAWGRIMARGQRAGRTPPSIDALFAATAEVRGLVLVTRNVQDFEGLDVRLLNPWEAD